MLEQRIAVVLANLRLPLRKALHTAAQLGAKAVEIDARNDVQPEEFSQTGLRQFRKLLDDLGLRVASVAFPTRRGYDVVEKLDERIAATKRAMLFAHALGAKVVINQVGRVPSDEADARWATMIEVLSELGAFGHHVGAFLAAKTGSESGPDLARLIHALPAQSIGVDLDPGRLIVNGFSASEAVSALAGEILHVTATDAVRDLALGRGLEVQLGRGSVDFPELVARLEEQGYRGWFTIDRRVAADPISEIGQAVEYLQNIG